LSDDAPWYESALVAGITNALNVVADGLGGLPGDPAIAPLDETRASGAAADIFAEIRAFYDRSDVPLVFRVIAHDEAYARDVWAATRRAFSDGTLARRFKEALAFAVSLTSRSPSGVALHLGEMRRLGVGEPGIREVLGVTQMFSSYTKIADTLQLTPDMVDLAPPDRSPAPGGRTPGA
jgi:Carboxymuconolactone decarboxylase family